MQGLVKGILFAWDFNRDYANRLVADLSDEQMVFQPHANMNHPAWVFSHLTAYHPVLRGLLRGETPPDPLDHPFGMKSKPVPDASVYPSKQALVDTFTSGHDEIAAALRAADAAALSRPMPLARWQPRWATVGECLGYLMLYHESTHLGQLSAWRRAQGLGAV